MNKAWGRSSVDDPSSCAYISMRWLEGRAENRMLIRYSLYSPRRGHRCGSLGRSFGGVSGGAPTWGGVLHHPGQPSLKAAASGEAQLSFLQLPFFADETQHETPLMNLIAQLSMFPLTFLLLCWKSVHRARRYVSTKVMSPHVSIYFMTFSLSLFFSLFPLLPSLPSPSPLHLTDSILSHSQLFFA